MPFINIEINKQFIENMLLGIEALQYPFSIQRWALALRGRGIAEIIRS
jgi:hypothetical protein